jgi:type IV secretion system protein VirB10
MKVAARQSAISFFNNADPRQGAGLQNLLPTVSAQPDASPPADRALEGASTPSPGGRATALAPAVGGVNPFVTLAAAATSNSTRLATRGASHTVYPGTIIKARLDAAIDTTHPSSTRARVVETVFDHRRGLVPVIPQGTTLVGEPSSNTRYGQERVFIAWTQMTFPDGRIVDVSGMSAGDAAGRGGKEADVDNHYPELFATAVLSSLLSVGATVAGGEPEDPLTLQNRAAQGLGNSVSNTGTTLLGRAAAIPPTLTLQPGELVTIIVNRPITVETVEPQ